MLGIVSSIGYSSGHSLQRRLPDTISSPSCSVTVRSSSPRHVGQTRISISVFRISDAPWIQRRAISYMTLSTGRTSRKITTPRIMTVLYPEIALSARCISGPVRRLDWLHVCFSDSSVRRLRLEARKEHPDAQCHLDCEDDNIRRAGNTLAEAVESHADTRDYQHRKKQTSTSTLNSAAVYRFTSRPNQASDAGRVSVQTGRRCRRQPTRQPQSGVPI